MAGAILEKSWNKKAGIENENVKNRIIIIENSGIFTMENVKLKVLEPIK